MNTRVLGGAGGTPVPLNYAPEYTKRDSTNQLIQYSCISGTSIARFYNSTHAHSPTGNPTHPHANAGGLLELISPTNAKNFNLAKLPCSQSAFHYDPAAATGATPAYTTIVPAYNFASTGTYTAGKQSRSSPPRLSLVNRLQALKQLTTSNTPIALLFAPLRSLAQVLATSSLPPAPTGTPTRGALNLSTPLRSRFTLTVASPKYSL